MHQITAGIRKVSLGARKNQSARPIDDCGRLAVASEFVKARACLDAVRFMSIPKRVLGQGLGVPAGDLGWRTSPKV
jgi:hypothetical protein